MGGGVQQLVGVGLGGGTQSWCRGGVGNGGWQVSLGQKVVSIHPFDPGKSKGVTITLIHRECRRSTVVGEISVEERGYDEGNEEHQGGNNSSETTAVTAAATATVPAAAKGWMRDGMEHHRPPLTVARLHLNSSSMICSSAASLDY